MECSVHSRRRRSANASVAVRGRLRKGRAGMSLRERRWIFFLPFSHPDSHSYAVRHWPHRQKFPDTHCERACDADGGPGGVLRFYKGHSRTPRVRSLSSAGAHTFAAGCTHSRYSCGRSLLPRRAHRTRDYPSFRRRARGGPLQTREICSRTLTLWYGSAEGTEACGTAAAHALPVSAWCKEPPLFPGRCGLVRCERVEEDR